MSNTLEYKGYYTNIEIDFGAREFYGEIENIKGLVNFQSDISEGIDGITREFHNAVDDYLSFCKEVNIMPEHSLKVAEYA